MFNHARTLLVNRRADQSPGPDYLAEELIPPEFTPLSLPSYLLRLREWLFGTTPDRAMLNYRTRQLLSLIHATETEQFVLDLDPRITYEIHNEEDLIKFEAFRPLVEQYSGVPATFSILGDYDPPDSVGQLRYDFDVDVLLGNTIEVKRLTPKSQNQILDLTLTNGLSQQFDLPGVGWKFQINTDNPGAAWRIGGYLRPKWSLGSLATAIERLGEPLFLELFGPQPTGAYRTFYNLWWSHLELPYRLAGLTLAIIYRTEEVRRGQS